MNNINYYGMQIFAQQTNRHTRMGCIDDNVSRNSDIILLLRMNFQHLYYSAKIRKGTTLIE